MGPEKSYHFFA